MKKQILITGSTSGIGKALAARCLQEGFQVIGVARDQTKVAEFGEDYIPYTVDLNITNELESKFKTIIKNHPKISSVVLCGGVGKFVELEQFSVDEMQRLLNVNFLSQAILIKLILPNLKKLNDAKIVFLGSECALQGQKKGSLYCAAKFALRGFSQSLRQECRNKGVAVTLINPGMVRTPFFDKLNFAPGEDERHAILPEQVVETIRLVLNMKNTCVIEEINCQPLQKVIKRSP